MADASPFGPAAPHQPRPVLILATWSQRARAAALDGALLLVPTLGLWAVLLPPVFGAADLNEQLRENWERYVDTGAEAAFDDFVDQSLTLALLIALVAVVSASLLAGLYHGAFLASTGGQTPGKRVAGICVVRADGGPVTLGWSLWRSVVLQRLLWLPLLLPTLGAAQVLQYLWPLWDDQSRALHDFLARSRVVRAAARQP